MINGSPALTHLAKGQCDQGHVLKCCSLTVPAREKELCLSLLIKSHLITWQHYSDYCNALHVKDWFASLLSFSTTPWICSTSLFHAVFLCLKFKPVANPQHKLSSTNLVFSKGCERHVSSGRALNSWVLWAASSSGITQTLHIKKLSLLALSHD